MQLYFQRLYYFSVNLQVLIVEEKKKRKKNLHRNEEREYEKQNLPLYFGSEQIL